MLARRPLDSAVCGDGGFGIAMNGPLMDVEQCIPIVEVFHNGCLAWIYRGPTFRDVTSPLAAR